MTLFTIIIPLYNKRQTVMRALNSVLAQTMQDFEVIVVNDGSTDGGEKLAGSLTDNRIRILHQANHGVSAARNLGIKAARGEFVAFLDADDEWMPGYLTGIRGLLKSFPECAVFATNYEYVYSDGKSRLPELNNVAVALGSSNILENYFQIAADSDPPLWTSAVVVRKGALEKVHGFPGGIVAGEDLLTWARLATQGKIAYFNVPLARFHFPADFSDREKRYVQPESCGDTVIEGLLELAGTSDLSIRSQLTAYIGRVAEIAAVSAISNGHYVAAGNYARLAWKYGKKNAKVITVSACSLLSVAGIGCRIWTWLFRRHQARRAGRTGNRRD